MAKSLTEQLRELVVEIQLLKEREKYRDREQDRRREELAEERRQRQHAEAEIATLKQEDAVLRQDQAVLRQQTQDHISQYQEYDRRRWGLIMLLVGTILSLASGPIVTLAKK